MKASPSATVGLVVALLYSSHHAAGDHDCLDIQFTCDSGECVYQYETCDQINDCLDGSDESGCEEDAENIAGTGFIVFINLIFFFVLPLAICICIGCYISHQNKRIHRRRRPVVMRVVPPNHRSRGATVVTLNQRHTPAAFSQQATSSVSAAVPYPQEPVYKDAQLSCQDAPPSYFEATAYPAFDAQQAAKYPPNPVAAYPPHQSPAPYPQDVPSPNQAYPPSSQPIPQPDL